MRANTGTGRYVYNGDGLRVRASTKATGQGTVDNDYVWSQGDGLPVVLQDVRTQSGVSGTTTFVYGLDLISATDGAGATSYYLSDGLGSTRALTDGAGAVTDTYSYDVYGAVRAQTGTTNNDFRYTGEQTDHGAQRGLQYLRARDYDPALGRFLSKDRVETGNRYNYASSNPTKFVDPAGTCSVEVVLRRGDSSSSGGIFGLGAWHHAYLVTTDPLTGEKSVHEGWNSGGLIYRSYSQSQRPNARAFKGYAGSPKRTVYDDAGGCEDIDDQLSTAGAAINAVGFKYEVLWQNSSSVARELLEAAGLPQQKPRGWTPAWGAT